MDKILVANWKQNKNEKEVKDWLIEFEEITENFEPKNIGVLVAPPFPYLNLVKEFANKYDWFHVGAQDVSIYSGGSHTGEVSAKQLKDFVEFCIVGHSERDESDEVVLKKTKECVDNLIVPIVCFNKLERLKLFGGIKAYYLWEDPSTISKNGKFSPKPINEIKKGVDNIISSYDIGEGLLYGGSINKDNIENLSKIPNLKGGVSGCACLYPRHFFDLVKVLEGIS